MCALDFNVLLYVKDFLSTTNLSVHSLWMNAKANRAIILRIASFIKHLGAAASDKKEKDAQKFMIFYGVT
jgi:hypothetical protein